MTVREYRTLALSFPEAVEREHMGHPDFRVGGKIFATLWPDDGWGMVKLTLEQQEFFIENHPKAFQAISGGWGARGATKVLLPHATRAIVRLAMQTAWRNTAPKRLVRQFEDD
jgi:hypothetical protein